MRAQVGSLWEVLAQQAVRVFIRASLPRAVRVAEVDLHAGVDTQAGVLAHFSPLIPGQGSPQLNRQRLDRARDGIAYCLRAMARERRAVLRTHSVAMARHGRQVKQQREPRGALDQRANRRTS